MRSRLVLVTVVVTMLAGMVLAQGQGQRRLNPMIELMQKKLPVLGLYMPADRSGATPISELAKQAATNHQTDFIFSGGTPRDFDQWTAGLTANGTVIKGASPRLTHPIMLKIHKIADEADLARAQKETTEQLNAGASGQMFVEVESAAEVVKGLSYMRFKSNGGVRPDDVGNAPAYWGLSEAQYKQKADVWPLNPNGELVNWTIIESKEGLAKTREIAAVKGIGVLWPGAGTLGGVFSTTGADGRRVRDEVAWENSIQQVLAACKEFNVACGYPASAGNIEMRMKQGFSVFVMGWGEDGFKAVETGRKLSNRPATNDNE